MVKEQIQPRRGGKPVYLEKDMLETDRYGRLLRYVYADGLMVNAVRGYRFSCKACAADALLLRIRDSRYQPLCRWVGKLAGRSSLLGRPGKKMFETILDVWPRVTLLPGR